MNHDTAPAPVSPEQLRAHTQFWLGFTGFMKFGVISVVLILILMVLFLY